MRNTGLEEAQLESRLLGEISITLDIQMERGLFTTYSNIVIAWNSFLCEVCCFNFGQISLWKTVLHTEMKFILSSVPIIPRIK